MANPFDSPPGKKPTAPKKGESVASQALHGGESVLLRVLNIADRPAQAAKGFIHGNLQEHSIPGAPGAMSPEGVLRGLGEAWRGLSGHQQLSFQQAIGTHVKGPAGTVLNFAGDVAVDPTTYVSFGTSTAAKSGLKAAGEHLGANVAKDIATRGTRKALTVGDRVKLRAALVAREGGSEKAADRVLKALDKGARGGVKVGGRTVVPSSKLGFVIKPGSAVKGAIMRTKAAEAIVPRAAIANKFGGRVAEDIGAASSRARAQAGNATSATVNRIMRSAKSAKVTTGELRDIVLPAIDIGGHAVPVPPRLQPLVDDLKDIIASTTARQQAADVLPGARPDYIARFLTPEAKKALGPDDAERFLGGMGRQPGAIARQAGKLKGRTFMPDAPLTDADKALAQTLGLKGAAYETNPLLTTAKRSALADRAIAQKHMFDDLAHVRDEAGNAILQPARGRKPVGWATVDAGPLGRFHAPREIADELAKVRAVVTNDSSIHEFDGLLGKLNTMWKSQATVPFLGGFGFHLRNWQGNVFNNFLAGVQNPADYLKATRIQVALTKAHGDTALLSAADRHLVELAEKHGVLDEGFFLHDLMDPAAKGGALGRVAADMRGARIRALANPVSTENAAIRSGRALGSTVENNARLAHFIAKLRELGSADEAARSVKKYLFDYGDLTDFERNKIKKVIPFWTWMRKNTPLQFAEAARQPGKFTALAHANAEARANSDLSVLPPFLRDEPYAPVGVHGQTIAMRPDLPPLAALESLDPRKQSDLGIFGGIVPSALKYAVEEKTGKSLFTGFNTKGSTPQRLAEAILPLVGKIRRSPYGHSLPTGAGVGLNTDNPDQALARLVSALTGLRTYRTDDADTVANSLPRAKPGNRSGRANPFDHGAKK